MGKKGNSNYVRMQQSASRSSNVHVQKEQQQEPKLVQRDASGKKERDAGLLNYLAFHSEYREDGGVTPEIQGGRFRYFADVIKRRSNSILVANLMFMLFALPLVAVFVAVLAMGGVEKIAYLLQNMDAPYLLSDMGFGISSSAYTLDGVKENIFEIYYLIFAAAGVASILLGLGLSGMMPLCMKFIIGDKFASKKDNYGNDVPKAIKEFFLGVKKYWWQYLIVGGFFCVLLAGFGNVFVYFVDCFNRGTANAGHWIMAILTAAVSLLAVIFLEHLIPEIVLYDMPFIDKMKNSAIFTIRMFVQNLFMTIVFAIPFVLIGVTGEVVSSIFVAALLVFGSMIYCLTMANYEQYLSEKIIQPIYKNQIGEKMRKEKKGKKQKK